MSASHIVGKTLRVATVSTDVSVFAYKSNLNGTLIYSGVAIEILNYIANQLKFTYVITEPEDGHYGTRKENGTYSGLVGMLQNQEIDLAAADLTATYDRSLAIDFTTLPYFYDTMGILLINQGNQAEGIKLFDWVAPFSWPVWLCLLGALALVSLILYLGHNHCNPHLWVDEKFRKLDNCVAYVGGGYVGQAQNVSPTSWWGQILLTFWWLLCTIEIASYGGFLVCTLTAPTPQQLPFADLKSLADLLSKNEYKICLESGTSFSQAIKTSNFTELVQINSWLERNPTYRKKSRADCLDRVMNETDVAFISEASYLELYQRLYSEQKNLILLRDNSILFYYSFGLPKHSPFREAISDRLQEIVEQGLVPLWHLKYRSFFGTRNTEDDADSVQVATQTLSIYDLGGVFVLLCAGVGTSAIVLVMEQLKKKKMFPIISNQLHPSPHQKNH